MDLDVSKEWLERKIIEYETRIRYNQESLDFCKEQLILHKKLEEVIK